MIISPPFLIIGILSFAVIEMVMFMRLMDYIQKNNPTLYKKYGYQLAFIPSVHKHNKRVSFVYYLFFYDNEDDEISLKYKNIIRILFFIFLLGILLSIIV